VGGFRDRDAAVQLWFVGRVAGPIRTVAFAVLWHGTGGTSGGYSTQPYSSGSTYSSGTGNSTGSNYSSEAGYSTGSSYPSTSSSGAGYDDTYGTGSKW
jgi:hypothetical protein